MNTPANSPSRSALSGNAKGFMAARRRRRQQLEAPPQLRWERLVVASAGSELHADGTPVWALQLSNVGGAASGTTVVLFTSEAVVRDETGGSIGGGQRWDFTLNDMPARPSEPIWGYALAQSGDGLWLAWSVDGRAATFRSRPDELGVLRTLGLRMPLGAAPHSGVVRTEHTAAELPR